MNILFLADVPANPDSGAAGTEYQTIEGLRRLGHDVDAVWSNGLPHRIKHGNLHYLFELPSAYRKRMQMMLRLKPYEVVHINQPHGYLAAQAVARFHSQTVFIHRSHGFELRVERDLQPWQKLYSPDKRSQLRQVFSRTIGHALSHHSKAIARYADGHIVSASQCREFLYQELGVAPDRITVIPQAPPPVFSESPALDMTSTRLRRVLYVGQFVFFKAPMIVAAIMNKLATQDAQLEFTWVCSKAHHSQVRELLSEETSRRFSLRDWMPQDELIKVYDQHGIFLFPSFFEGFGKVFLEAMSRGLCVIASDNGGARDVIRHSMNGMLSPTGNVETFVKCAQELLNQTHLAENISREAVNTARQYTWDRVAAETAAFYQDRLEAKLRTTQSRIHPRHISSDEHI
ncbi:MAG: glycosyltransferase family 4 protein [Blastocatellia bacterium]